MTRTFPSGRFVRARRRALFVLAASALLPAAAARARPAAPIPTPSQPEGPFYPTTFPADRDSDLTRIAGRAARARGTPLYLSGRVLARSGAPVGGAAVELWQCDAWPVSPRGRRWRAATTTFRVTASPPRTPKAAMRSRRSGSCPTAGDRRTCTSGARRRHDRADHADLHCRR
jgi:protocatechuate 3,4-dioxygenase beta subunit